MNKNRFHFNHTHAPKFEGFFRFEGSEKKVWLPVQVVSCIINVTFTIVVMVVVVVVVMIVGVSMSYSAQSLPDEKYLIPVPGITTIHNVCECPASIIAQSHTRDATNGKVCSEC
jgi:hypothetical protein